MINLSAELYDTPLIQDKLNPVLPGTAFGPNVQFGFFDIEMHRE